MHYFVAFSLIYNNRNYHIRNWGTIIYLKKNRDLIALIVITNVEFCRTVQHESSCYFKRFIIY